MKRSLHPQPTFLSLRDLWNELKASPASETLGEFLAGLEFRTINYGGSTKDVIYVKTLLDQCSECGKLSCDEPITGTLCEECLEREEWEAEQDYAHVQGLRSSYMATRGV